jgi:SAM-dependent methyltransferase
MLSLCWIPMTSSDDRPAGAKDHWNGVYLRKEAEHVSWYQPRLETSLDLIAGIGLPSRADIIDVGGGASTLVDDLLALHHTNVTVLDLAHAALEVARVRLGQAARRVTWLVGDVTTLPLPEHAYDLWHDRAVFHFLSDPESRRRYVETARRSLKPGGHIIVATFGPDGPDQCSGLDVVRYDAESLHRSFGGSFVKLDQRQEAHTTPWGTTQEFVYCYCRRSAT